MDPVSIILGLGQFVPSLLRWMNHDGAADVAEKAVAVGRSITGKESPDDVIAALKANPQLAVDFQPRFLANLPPGCGERGMAFGERGRIEDDDVK